MEQILEYVENKDSDGLKSMYSQKLLEAENIDQKTEDFINFIEGNVIEFENVDGGPSSGGSITDGIKTEWTLDSRWHILTDRAEYELYISQFTINEETLNISDLIS